MIDEYTKDAVEQHIHKVMKRGRVMRKGVNDDIIDEMDEG